MQENKRIYPAYAFVLTYNVREGVQERYFRYFTGELRPTLERHELYVENAWLIVYGDQPDRQVEFVSERLGNIRDLVEGPEWSRLENRLQDFADDLEWRIVPYNGHVKIVRIQANGK